jgi:hypothetical protein
MQSPQQTSGASDARVVAFLEGLSENGEAVVGSEPLETAKWHGHPIVEETLLEWDKEARLDAPYTAPELDLDTATWAASLFYRLCQFSAIREKGAGEIQRILEEEWRIPQTAAAVWAADLTLRHLPRLHQLVREISPGDPLLASLEKLGTTWALSSVGMPGIQNPALDLIRGNASLLRLYLDRIILSQDSSRLGNPQIDALLRADLDLYRHIAPALNARLFAVETETAQLK